MRAVARLQQWGHSMAVWLVRAGRNGERQDFALDNNVSVIGWDAVPDVRTLSTKEELRTLIENQHPNANPRKISASTGQVWNFVHKLKIGDYVALPLKGQSAVAFGKCSGEYEYLESNPAGAKHFRPVNWIRQDIPRDDFPQDILNSLGSLLTVSQVRAGNAEQRMLAIAEGKPQPPINKLPPDKPDDDEPPTKLNLEAVASDEIREYLNQNFAGHALADLVNAILVTQGYQTQVSPPGPDGGVDIIAGRGPLGFDPPRLVVQVKATKGQQDVKVLRELKGVMSDYRADQGLFVSWGGFTRDAVREAKKAYFEIRLWDSGDLVAAILRHYDQFGETLRADLPLKRVWTLVQEEAD